MVTKNSNFILASSSRYRQQLLQKILPEFSSIAPEIDETKQPNETTQQMVERLSLQKAQAIANQHPNSIVIASDQSAEFDQQTLGKPGNFERALEQLTAQQGKIVKFYTGLAVFDPAKQKFYQALDITMVHFRQLDQATLENYLTIEQPFNCAGSFKSEGLGIMLFNQLETKDPNALIGLPLIQLTSILLKIGVKLPLQ